MRIGFIGTGNITAAMVNGFCTADPAPTHILLSPRTAKISAELAARYDTVSVAADNQAVVDGSDWVVLAVLPQTCREVIGELTFRPEQRIVSVIASLTTPELEKLIAPATRYVRCVPLPPCADHVGPIAMCPKDADAEELFGRIGAVVAVDDAHRFDSLNAISALMGAFFKFQGVSNDWLIGQGVDNESGKRYISAMCNGIARQAFETGEDFGDLINEASTPGGMNEQVVREMVSEGSYDYLPTALDRILDRLQGRA